MFNRKIAILLCGLGVVFLLVENATTVQIASFFSIIASSVFLLKQQEKKLKIR
jgi:hypothetical protein